MFKSRTTIVIGAGASCELGLPSGDLLKSQISEVLKVRRDNFSLFNDETLFRLMRDRAAGARVHDVHATLGPYRQAAEHLRRALPLAPSIDNLLHSHQNDQSLVELGKLAIAICILRAESSSLLFERGIDINRLAEGQTERRTTLSRPELQDTWYPRFIRILFAQVPADDIGAAFRNVQFVIFNYDRCFEHCLWMALQDYFFISGEEAAEYLSDVAFIHPYGSLGPLPWRGNSDAALALGDVDYADLWKVAGRLRTFTETVTGSAGRRVADAIAYCETILLLGFGFLEQNLALLGTNPIKEANRVLTTAYGISIYDQAVVHDAMESLKVDGRGTRHIENGTCRNLFDNFRLLLSAS